jgi:hypothetical protein
LPKVTWYLREQRLEAGIFVFNEVEGREKVSLQCLYFINIISTNNNQR